MPRRWVNVILELGTTAVEFSKDTAGLPWIRMSPLYSAPPGDLQKTRFCTALVTKEFFQKLYDDDAALRAVKRFELGLPIVPRSFVQPHATEPFVPKAQTPDPSVRCVVGIIDDGFAFAHERFRRRDGKTRIACLWHQGYFSPDITEAQYGREITGAEIDQYVADASRAGYFDEAAIYRLAGYDEVRRRLAHGTTVADVACGCDPDDGTLDAQRLICVQLQLPSRRTRDRSAGWLAVRVLDGIRYILDRASQLASGIPVVVNLSFGNIAGPHDGTSMIECAIEELIEARQHKLAVVLAAGNSALSECHADADLAAREKKHMVWRVLPDDATPNFMEIWSYRSDPELNIKIATPDGHVIGPIAPGGVAVWPEDDPVCTVVNRQTVATGSGRMVLIAISPTTSTDRSQRLAPAGDWKVTLQNTSADKLLTTYAWIQRDETPVTFPRHGRQSRFNDPDYSRSDRFLVSVPVLDRSILPPDAPGPYVRRESTINSLATSPSTIVIGSYVRSNGKAAPYSSRGPALAKEKGKNARDVPDAAAVSEDSITCVGVLAAATRSGAVVVMNGTSMAAAAVTRLAASQMSEGKRVDRTTIAQQARRDEKAWPSPKPPPEQVGAGRLRTPQTTKVVRWRGTD
jgi:hypothetical protein